MTTMQDVLWRKLETQITTAAAALDAVLGVAVLDLSDGRSLLYHADFVFPTASVIKIPILAELYRQSGGAASEPGAARLSDLYTMDAADLVEDSYILGGLTPGVTRLTLRDLATCMIAVSDNAATNVLIDRVGLDNVNRLLDSLSLPNTRLRRKMMDVTAAREGRENTSTPREMAQLLDGLYRGGVVQGDLRDDLLRVLATRKDSFIPRRLPAETVVANKPGVLEGVRNDAGIVYGRRPFVLSVFTAYALDELHAEAVIADIALAAYRHFDQLGRATPYGRLMT